MILPLLLAAALGATPAPAPTTPADITRWLTYYYLEPHPEWALPILDSIEAEMPKHGRSLADEAGRGGIRTFYAHVFAANPAVVAEVTRALPSLSSGRQA